MKLAVLTWCGAITGAVCSAEDVGSVLAEHGVTYFVDACQVLGLGAVDVRRLRCHALFASGRKWLRGPRGTALLYASRAFLSTSRPRLLDQAGSGRSDARRYERGEFNAVGRVGLAQALRQADALDIEAAGRRVETLSARLRDGLAQLPGVRVHSVGADMGEKVDVSGRREAVAKLSGAIDEGIGGAGGPCCRGTRAWRTPSP